MANLGEMCVQGVIWEHVGRRGHSDGEVKGMITHTRALA